MINAQNKKSRKTAAFQVYGAMSSQSSSLSSKLGPAVHHNMSSANAYNNKSGLSYDTKY